MTDINAVKRAGSSEELTGKTLEALFWAYFNNKMTVLLMMIEHPELAKSTISAEKQKMFLHDLYHHFLDCHAPTKYHHAFKWLNRYLGRYPEVHYSEVYRAIKMVSLIYEAFGKKLDSRIEAMRIEKESVKVPPQKIKKGTIHDQPRA